MGDGMCTLYSIASRTAVYPAVSLDPNKKGRRGGPFYFMNFKI